MNDDIDDDDDENENEICGFCGHPNADHVKDEDRWMICQSEGCDCAW